jgi:SAM-dependent methyltransferase
MTSSDLWTEDQAQRYDDASAAMFAPDVLGPTLDVLERLADGRAALELAIGTGRVGVPLRERGVPVSGIELSQPMVDVLRTKVGPEDLPVVVGDMATARVEGEFSLVYLVFNTIGNLRTQDEQVACFVNAARHLSPGGRFVIEVGMPPLRRMPPGQNAVPFTVDEGRLGFDTVDSVEQQATSHHLVREEDGRWSYGPHHYRYVWPSELDLMARLAGLERESRWEDWHENVFTSESDKHVSVWRKPV